MPELIDRLLLIDRLDWGQKKALDAKDFMSFYALVYFKVMLQESPTIGAEPVRNGRWISHKITASSACSECRHVFTDETPFCPNCGARMDADHIDDVSKKVGGADNG